MDNAIRAITIGVSTFIAVITISAIMMYYSSARDVVQSIGTGTNLAQNYNEYIKDILVKPGGKLLGSDVKNILNYFYGNNSVEIIIEGGITPIGTIQTAITNPSPITSNEAINQNSQLYNQFVANIIDEKKFIMDQINYLGSSTEIQKIVIKETKDAD